MTIQTWISGTSGDWSTAADWMSGVVPKSTDDVVINSSGSDVTVTGTAVADSFLVDNLSYLTVSGTLTLGTWLTLENDTHLTDSGTLTLGTSLTFDENSIIELSGGTISAQSIVSDDGTGLLGGYGTISGAVVGNVLIEAGGGTLTVEGSLAADQGYFLVAQNATLELSNASAATVDFEQNSSYPQNSAYGNPGTLKLDAPAAFTGSINDIGAGDMIDLAGITASSASYNGSTLTINETNGQQLTYNASGSSAYNASGGLATDAVLVASDDNGGTLLFFANPAPAQATTVEQEIAGLYAAVYNRAADAFGMQYWVNVVAQQADALGITYSAAANTPISTNDAALLGQLFVSTQSAYFNQTYANLTDANFVNALYFNIGGQNAETPSAVAYWVNIIQNSEASGLSVQNARAAMVGQFVHDLIDVNLSQWTTILTPSDLETTILRQAVVDNKLAVSLAYLNASANPSGAILDAHAVGDAGFQAEVRVLNFAGVAPTAEIATINQAVSNQDVGLVGYQPPYA